MQHKSFQDFWHILQFILKQLQICIAEYSYIFSGYHKQVFFSFSMTKQSLSPKYCLLDLNRLFDSTTYIYPMNIWTNWDFPSIKKKKKAEMQKRQSWSN